MGIDLEALDAQVREKQAKKEQQLEEKQCAGAARNVHSRVSVRALRLSEPIALLPSWAQEAHS